MLEFSRVARTKKIILTLFILTLIQPHLSSFSEILLGEKPELVGFENTNIFLFTKEKLQVMNMFTKEIIQSKEIKPFKTKYSTISSKYAFLSENGKKFTRMDLKKQNSEKIYSFDKGEADLVSNCDNKLIIASKGVIYVTDLKTTKKLDLEDPKLKITSIQPRDNSCSSILIYGEDYFGVEIDLNTLKTIRKLSNPLKSGARAAMLGKDNFLLYKPKEKIYKGKLSPIYDLENLNKNDKENFEDFEKLKGIPYTSYAIGISKKNKNIKIFYPSCNCFSRILEKGNVEDFFIYPGYNLFVSLKKYSNEKYKLTLYQVPEAGNCSSCPICKINSKSSDCLFCAEKNHFWINGKCLDCSKGSKNDSKCKKISNIILRESKDVFNSQNLYFDLTFQNQQNYTMKIQRAVFDDIVDVSIDDVKRSDYEFRLKKDSGKIRLIVNFKKNILTPIKTKIRLIFKAWDLRDWNNNPFIYLKRISTLTNFKIYKNSKLFNFWEELGFFWFIFLYIIFFLVFCLAGYFIFFKGINLAIYISQFYILMKSLAFFSLINSDMGPILGPFLSKAKLPLTLLFKTTKSYPAAGQQDKSAFFGMKSWSFMLIPDRYILLLICWIVLQTLKMSMEKIRLIILSEGLSDSNRGRNENGNVQLIDPKTRKNW